ncbi:TPA: YccT family protein [Photobacterium damselae]
MKKIICSVLPLVSLFSSNIYADVKLESSKETNILVVNGKEEGWSFIKGTNEVVLPNGENQILFNIGAVVLDDAAKKKFNSVPLLIKFDVKDIKLVLEYPKIRTLEQAESFDKSPKITLKNSAGDEVKFEYIQLNKSGLQNFRDYAREVADYNKTGGIASIGYMETMVINPTTSSSVSASSPAAKMKFLKNAFIGLSEEEKQEFMTWGLKNL